MNKKLVWTLAAVASVAAIGAAVVWQRNQGRSLPDNVAQANGRLELARVDVAVKYGGRIVDLPVHEGDVLAAGAVVARQDNDELRAQLDAAKAIRERAADAATRAAAQLDASGAQVRLAQLESSQAIKLFDDAQISPVERDRRRLALEGAQAGESAARAASAEAQSAIAEADAQVARMQAVLNDTIVRAPLAGRVEYRVVEVGTVLPAGGRVVSMLNPDDIYFTIFLPGPQAGKLAIGADARIVLDAFPREPIAARISYVSDDAQFTPKYVETDSERAKLMYRVKLQLPLDVARKLASRLKGGMTGEGYVRVDPSRPWPQALAVRGS
ncbi:MULTISPECIES: HlyD family secretion protein [Paraburkholderia]|uniref:HlyD family secretion protein n=1 Tax=Paraburkholderia TaxID=1822464 RepID=UPI00162231FD|nr:HlyD family efflux transporter periplasmic adaptor subunit [Paraburkholderia tropica]MBB3000488.1 HlyD family secretion protein [Paraburkholderia tropica]MBB6320117.1 HlyD family secretion protein [Paraburkholderia tropica]